MLPGVDPETDSLVKLGLKDVRDVEAGRLTLAHARNLPDGTRLEGGRVAPPLAGVGSALMLLFTHAGTIALLVLTGVLIGSAVRWLLLVSVAGVPVYAGFAVATCCLGVGALFFWFRDLQSWPSIALLQIGVATLGGTFSLLVR
jgi:hypothetical protein